MSEQINNNRAARDRLASQLLTRIKALESHAPDSLRAADDLRRLEGQALAAATEAQLLHRRTILERLSYLDRLDLDAAEKIRAIVNLKTQFPDQG